MEKTCRLQFAGHRVSLHDKEESAPVGPARDDNTVLGFSQQLSGFRSIVERVTMADVTVGPVQ